MESGIRELAFYRITRAGEDLESAERLLKENEFRLALNRSYYAIFHALTESI